MANPCPDGKHPPSKVQAKKWISAWNGQVPEFNVLGIIWALEGSSGRTCQKVKLRMPKNA